MTQKYNQKYRLIRIGEQFNDLLADFKKEVPLRKKNPDFTEELTATIRSSKIDIQIKNLLRRRYNWK